MGTANRRTTIDYTHTKRKSKPNTTLKMVIKPQEKRTREEGNKKRSTKTNPNQLIRKVTCYYFMVVGRRHETSGSETIFSFIPAEMAVY